MKSHRRAFVGLVSGALVLGGGLAATPPAAAVDEVIYVSAYPDFRINAGEIRMTEEEFLEIAPFSGQAGAYVVRLFDYAKDGAGRPLLIGSAGCVPFALPSASVVCTFNAPPSSVRVDFLTATGPTNVAIMDEAPIALNFRGSAGADYVVGGGSNDSLSGLGGNDRLYGGPGDDLLQGDQGDDYLEGEQGRDDMRGGPGIDSLDAADGIADTLVDCGGPPGPLFDFDDKLDVPTNCGANPTPIPPSPVEPIDPPAPGTGEGTVDGVPTTVEVTRDPQAPNSVIVTTSSGPILNTGLLWIGPTAPEPTFPLNSLFFPVNFAPLMPNTFVNVSLWNAPPPGPTPLNRAARSAAVEDVEIRVDAQGVAKGTVPVPQGQGPGNFVMQINGVTATGGQMSINVGVVLAEKTPEPDPGPDESIAITSATRGKGKKAATITVKGTAVGLDGEAVTARYRVQGAKSWISGPTVTVRAGGSYVLRLKTSKKVRIQVVSGAIRSPGVVVAAVKR